MASIDLDYAVIYKDVNQLRLGINRTECSPVMAIHRMYFRLDDLHADLLKRPEVVKELYVFADVVEMEGESVELPGSSQVTILCRVLKVKQSAVIRLSSLSPVDCSGKLTVWHPMDPGPDTVIEISETWEVTPKKAGGRVVTILASHLVAPVGVQLRVKVPVNVEYQTNELYPRPLSTVAGTVEWLISPYSAVAAHSFNLATASSSAGIRTAGLIWQANVKKWQPGFKIVLPEVMPLELFANSNIVLGVEVTTLMSEVIITYQGQATEAVATARLHVEWLNAHLLSTQSSGHFDNKYQLQALHFRVQSVLKLHVGGENAPLLVPPLQYETYDRLINLMARVAESYDDAFNQLNLFVQQNEILASFLLEQNKAFSAKERDMESHHSQLMSLQDADLTAANEKIKGLNNELDKQNQAMEKAQADMEAGIKQYKDRLVAEAVFGVFTAIAQVCLAIFTGGATAAGAVATARKLSETAKALQSAVEFIERLQKIVQVINAVTNFLTNLQTLNELIELPEMPDLPTEADWDIFENEVVAVAEGMPTEVSEVPMWKAQCKNVAAIGREIIKTVAYMQQLQYNLAVEKMLQNIAQQQAERLQALQIEDLDNYMEMATQLDTRTNRLLLVLLRVLSLQTGALSYHFLLPHKPLSGWVRMDAVWNLMIKNEYDALTALAALGSAPVETVMSYVVRDIPVGLLVQGNDWFFDIPVHDPAFPSPWFRIRIEYVELKFPTTVHLPTTDSGQVYFLLQATRFFKDRFKDEVLDFQAAAPVSYQYAYRLDTGETTRHNRPSPAGGFGHYMRMTPFTRWRLRLSASSIYNQGLAFPTATTEDATTQITINFHVTAIHQIQRRI